VTTPDLRTDTSLARADVELVALLGDSAQSVSEPTGFGFVVTPDGIELTFDENDGLPGVVSPFTVFVGWNELPPIGS
jgi:hypothetical protein